MTDEESETSARRLAEEIRRGVREAMPHASADTPDGASPLREVWDAAERFAVPAIPAGASLPFLKKAILRVLRISTRSQGTFNMRMLEGARRLDRSLAALARELEEMERRFSRETDVIHARLASREGGTATAVPPPLAASPALSDGLYARFEEEFRGTEETIRERQRGYVDFFRGISGVVLDCGCGRGEFVELLAQAGIEAAGIETNRVAVALARRRGARVDEGDAFERLRSLRGSLGGVAALQFVEHLPPGSVRDFLGLAFDALAPGGRLLVETINPDSLYAMRAYRLDPTHVWPVPSAALSLLARDAGFEEEEIRFVSPVPPGEALDETNDNERKLNRWIFGFQDYALFARRPEA